MEADSFAEGATTARDGGEDAEEEHPGRFGKG